MKLLQSLPFLLALTRAATGLFTKKYIFVNTPLSWIDAEAYCQAHYTDFSIITSQADLECFLSVSLLKTGWIGLSKKPEDLYFTQWCDGTAAGFTYWAKNQPVNIKKCCVYTYEDQWYSDFCETSYPFYCYTWQPQLIMVPEMKTWHEALEHCRTYHTDLISLISNIDLVFFNKTMDVTTPRVWTGLRFMDGEWSWVNSETLGTLVSLPSCPVTPFHCGATTGANVFENRDCNEKLSFICYSM